MPCEVALWQLIRRIACCDYCAVSMQIVTVQQVWLAFRGAQSGGTVLYATAACHIVHVVSLGG